MIGQTASHTKLGKCVIRQIVEGGPSPIAVVDFVDLHLPKERVYLSELRDLKTGKRLEIEVPAAALYRRSTVKGDLVATKPDWHDPRFAIFALRLGQCPFGYMDRLTVGAEPIRDACGWALKRSDAGKMACLIFESEYGKGKTHALNLFASAALARERAVTSIVLDGNGVSLTAPMTILSALVSNIRFPTHESDNDQSLGERLSEMMRSGIADKLALNGADFLSECFARIPSEIGDNPEAWDTVMDYLSCELAASQAKARLRAFTDDGRAVPLPTISARRRDERPERCALMLREWAQTCITLGAHRGLVVLFDEADVDYTYSQSSAGGCEQREALFEEIRRIAEDKKHRCFLAMALAVTPGTPVSSWDEDRAAADEITQLLGSECVRRVSIPAIRKSEMLTLAKSVADVYAEGYNLPVFETSMVRSVAQKLVAAHEASPEGLIPRVFIREFIDFLDVETQKR